MFTLGHVAVKVEFPLVSMISGQHRCCAVLERKSKSLARIISLGVVIQFPIL